MSFLFSSPMGIVFFFLQVSHELDASADRASLFCYMFLLYLFYQPTAALQSICQFLEEEVLHYSQVRINDKISLM